MRFLPWLCIILAPTVCSAAELYATPDDFLARVAELQPGDVLLLAPGLYPCPAVLTLAMDGVTLRGPPG